MPNSAQYKSVVYKTKYISIGVMHGPVHRDALVQHIEFDIVGFAQRYKVSQERHSGVGYRVWHGKFYGRSRNADHAFTAKKCVLPPRGDQYVFSLYENMEFAILFRLHLAIVPCSYHSTGFDWAVSVGKPPTMLDIERGFYD